MLVMVCRAACLLKELVGYTLSLAAMEEENFILQGDIKQTLHSLASATMMMKD